MTALPPATEALQPVQIPEWTGVTRERFEAEILPAARPAVMRGLVRDWPLVQAARRSPAEAADHLRGYDAQRKVPAVMGPPQIGGRIFYNETLTGFNFQPGAATISSTLDYLLSLASDSRPPTVALQSVPVPANLPGLEAANPMPLLDETVRPGVWIGNRVIVAAHQDHEENIACVAVGRRRFTLFPPEQVANLYIGPFELTPAGAPISLVDFDKPDFDRHPRFADALAAAQTAELEPGDAIYIPYLWWHHVRSLDALNVLVNYWWPVQRPGHGHPRNALLHAIVAIRSLPEPQRSVWKALFEHYVFERNGDPAAHLPEAAKGLMGELDEASATKLREIISRMTVVG